MEMRTPITVPANLETVGHLIGVIAKHQVNTNVFVVRNRDKSIARYMVIKAQIEVDSTGDVSITYFLRNQNEPNQSPITSVQDFVFATLEEAAQSAWHS